MIVCGNNVNSSSNRRAAELTGEDGEEKAWMDINIVRLSVVGLIVLSQICTSTFKRRGGESRPVSALRLQYYMVVVVVRREEEWCDDDTSKH